MGRFTRWAPLFATNFFGVLNNNYLRNLIVFVSISQLMQTNKGLIVTLASGLYVMPYIFFSPLGGRLAKTHRKSDIMFWSKCAELMVFILSIVGFVFQSIYLVLFCVFAVGLISTLFSPSKYGLIRDIGGNEGLSFGTGTLEMFTFLGVLIGTFIASVVSDHYSHWLLAGILITVSVLQLFTTRILSVIKETTTVIVENDTLNPIKFFVRSYQWAKTIAHANVIILGLATFWMIGNFIVMNLLVHCEKVLHLSNTQTGFIMNISGLGIGIGSLLTGLLSRKKVQLGFTPLGAIGMVASFVALYIAHPATILFSVLIFTSSFFCGMYMVPLSAWVQHCVDGRQQGDMLAYSNFVVFLLILISAGLFGPIVAWFDTETVWLLLCIIIIIVQLIMLRKTKEMGEKFITLFKR